MYITEKSLFETAAALHSHYEEFVIAGCPEFLDNTQPCRKFKELLPRVFSLTFPDKSASLVT